MYKVLYNKPLNDDTYEMLIEAPHVIKNAIPGQFCIVMAYEDSERVPLTLYDFDKEKGLLYLIYQVVGASTLELTHVTDRLFSVSGPLGNGNEICANPEKYKDKRIVYVAGGVGVAPVYAQVKHLRNHGLNVDVIYGARSKNVFIITDKLEASANNVYYTSNDGSFGEEGFVTGPLERMINNYDICVAIGPVIMMKNVCELTKKYNLQTIVSMNPIMVDGSGMCGACRCMVDGKPRFACIHGPEFDGHKVDFDSALKRMNIYKEEEKIKLENMKQLLGGTKNE